MRTERDIAALVKVAVKEAFGLSEDDWEESPPLVKYEAMAEFLPIVLAILAEVDKSSGVQDNSEWDKFIAGH